MSTVACLHICQDVQKLSSLGITMHIIILIHVQLLISTVLFISHGVLAIIANWLPDPVHTVATNCLCMRILYIPN